MPIFEYAPNHNAHTADDQKSEEETALPVSHHACCFFEHIQRHGEPALTNCPTCGHPVRKVPSVFQAKVTEGPSDPITRRTVDALRASGQADFATAWEEAARSLPPYRRSANGGLTNAKKQTTQPSNTTSLSQIPQQEDHVPYDGRAAPASQHSVAQEAIRIASGHICTASCRHN